MRALFLFFCFMSFVHAESSELKLGGNYVSSETANVYEYPDQSSKVVGTKIFRQLVYVKEIKNGWARIGHYKPIDRDDNEVKSSEWVAVNLLVSIQPQLESQEFPSKYKEKAINEQIVRSTSGDKGRYFLVFIDGGKGRFEVISKRYGVNEIGYSKVEINCSNRVYRDLSYTTQGVEYFDNSRDSPGNWTQLIEGSSKSDLVRYVCGTRNY